MKDLKSTKALVKEIIKNYKGTLILDADGINAVTPNILKEKTDYMYVLQQRKRQCNNQHVNAGKGVYRINYFLGGHRNEKGMPARNVPGAGSGSGRHRHG